MSFLLKHYLTWGRLFFAIAMVASGIQQLIQQDFVRLVPKLPAWIPLPALWAGLSGVILIAAGLAIAVDWKRRPLALALSALFGVVFLLYLPGVFANPGAGLMWTNPCKTLALLSGAMLVAVVPAGDGTELFAPNAEYVRRFSLLCAGCLGVFLVVCGVQHFAYADFVEQLVPAWLAGRRLWAFLTGIALIAGGIGINLQPTARLAAALAGLMIFLWVPLLHIPRALASWPDAGETAGIFEALALSGTAFLISATGCERSAVQSSAAHCRSRV